MTTFFDILQKVASVIAVCLVMGWLLYRWMQKSEEPGALAFRWVLTAIDLALIALVVGPIVKGGGYVGAFVGVPAAAVTGLILAIIWVPHVTDSVGRAIGQLYDGGSVAADPEPLYSVAEARRKQGRYQEAIGEVEAQLRLFPGDVRGFLLLAEIQADDLHDLEGAGRTIDILVAQPGHAPKNLSFALTRLADWHLKYRRDGEAARKCFQRIVELLPDTQEAHLAHQRMAHIASTEFLAAEAAPAVIALPKADAQQGLLPAAAPPLPRHQDPAARAAELVAQLAQFPLDNQAREELAVLYADDFQRLDLATEQLEQLIAQPLAPQGHVLRWLSLLADLQLKDGRDVSAGRATLQRIIERGPESASADAARRRLTTLNLEARGRSHVSIALGTYDQDLGLKLKDDPTRKRDWGAAP